MPNDANAALSPADQAKFDKMVAEKRNLALARHQDTKQIQERGQANEVTTWRNTPGQPERVQKNDYKSRFSISVPTVDNTEAAFESFQRAYPRLVTSYQPETSEPNYKLPASEQWFGMRAAMIVIAMSRSGTKAGFDYREVPRIVSDLFGDKELSAMCERTFDFQDEASYKSGTSRSLDTLTPSSGGSLLLPQMLAAEFIPLLRKAVVLFRLGARQISMANGQAIIPGLAAGAVGGWANEKGHVNLTDLSLYKRMLRSKKGYAFAAVSRDLSEESIMDVLMMVRDDLVLALAELIEDGCINGTGGDNQPLGLLEYPGLVASTLGTRVNAYTLENYKLLLRGNNVNVGMPGRSSPSDSHDAMRKIGALIPPQLAFEFANLAASLGVFYYRNELDKGTLGGFPVEVSNFIAVSGASNHPTSMVFGDFEQAIVAVTRDIMVESSRDASFTDSDGNARNAFVDEIDLIKATKKIDFAVRQTGALVRETNAFTA